MQGFRVAEHCLHEGECCRTCLCSGRSCKGSSKGIVSHCVKMGEPGMQGGKTSLAWYSRRGKDALSQCYVSDIMFSGVHR